MSTRSWLSPWSRDSALWARSTWSVLSEDSARGVRASGCVAAAAVLALALARRP